MSNKIMVVEYNPEWVQQFETLKQRLLLEIEPYILSIEHVGSTAIPNLMAKPVLDMDIIINEDPNNRAEVLNRLQILGYWHIGEMGIVGREAFKRLNPQIPFTEPPREWVRHNLYLCQQGSMGLENHLRLRDYLLQNPEAVAEYSALKRQLAEAFPNDIGAYTEGKTEFILSILQRVGISESVAKQIALQNKQIGVK